MTWWDDVKARADVPRMAGLLGLEVANRAIAPCPSCGEKRRGRGDRRGPVVVPRPDRWSCLLCDAWGSSVDLVSFRVSGARFTARAPEAAEVRAFCAEHRLCEPAEERPHAPRLRPLPRPALQPSEPAREPPPLDEVAELWERCTPIGEPVARYLRGRAIDADVVLDEGLVRVPPFEGPLPSWASHWPAFDVAFVLPLFDVRGRLAGLQGRCTEGAKKSIRMKGVDPSGLLLATGTARQLLEAGAWPIWFAGRPTVLEVVEGEPDFLTRACRDPSAPILGIPGSGAWTRSVGGRVPAGSEVHVLTHQDDAGEKYSKLVAASLAGHCRVRRGRWAA